MTETAAWDALEAELAAWQAAGKRASFWWRDDDAVRPGPALDRLLGLAEAHGLPVALAVIPMLAEPALAVRLAEAPQATALQHGITHRNHAGPDEKKIELGGRERLKVLVPALEAARSRFESLLPAARRLPILVPPWNRIDQALVERLPAVGFRGLSRFTARRSREATPGLREVNTHIDPLRWRPSRGFLGTAAVLQALAAHLAARRLGGADPDEATGLLTHHAVHDPETWAFLENELPRLAAHPAVATLSAAEAFGL